ncbi:MAG: ABC transporter ATP-binding protein [Desulfatibacillaceae bacterium]
MVESRVLEPENPFIHVDGVTKAYVERRRNPRGSAGTAGQDERVLVLDDMRLGMGEGEIVCILGPSGCGKSTLMRIIAGFDTGYEGSVRIGGARVSGPSPHHIFVFQHNGLLPWMTVRQNVELGVRHVEDAVERNGIVEEHIEMVELGGFEDHYPHQLSGGMQRRAELARALAVNPEVLFFDEPFTGLDFLTHMRMREEVLNLHEFIGKTMLMVTHDIDDALVMGDRIVIFGQSRPTLVRMNRRLEFKRPRDFGRDPDLAGFREEVYLMMGVHHAL